MAEPRVFPDDVPVLVDREVSLRAHRPTDLDEMVVQCTDPLNIRWTTVPVPFTRQDATFYATKVMAGGWADGTEFGFAIEAPHPDGVHRFCGTVSLRWMGENVAEVAYGLHPAARGRGIARRAVSLLLDWGFTELGLDVVVWYAEVGNWRSRRVAWALGFSHDGTVARLLRQRGERKDAWVGSLRAGEPREPVTRWLSPAVLETERLRLRPLADEDAERLFEMLNDERARHYGGRTRSVREQHTGEQVLLRAREGEAEGKRYHWAVTERGDDRIIGYVQVFELDGLDETAGKLGYTLHADSRGKGYLAEVLTALTDHAFDDLGLRLLSLRTAASNTASRRGAERAGYAHVATEPAAFTIGDSDFDDLVVYQRQNPNWVRADPA
ncbi:hypothetical protein BLA60_32575 [Actinophytocola xinjiangensis]|uniref:N-acetyltransferase domain-containing protein n=1 Tax=Actinophytocola xinjiangensis TaxID=485602 RepID=A0A7Z1AWE3_9PSEU|nr:GNAT family N-acetyltransferase [Actinophytocola xinjiangensis]OLF06367.1 hypothetical protein BLA60_32575 [Actinophytocola xinjiangensis]